VPNAIVRLQATPASVTPTFSFGCGSNDGTASCDLGAMDAKSAQRQLQAESTVPVTASAVTSVRLTVIGSAAKLPKDPTSSATVAISGTVTPATSPLPVGTLPGVPTTGPTLSPGGNAANLFPTLKPSPSRSATVKARARQVADTSALPEGVPVVGAQLAGLAALVLAFVLAVTRLSIRRRPAPGTTAAGTTARAAKPAEQVTGSEPADGGSKPADDAAQEPDAAPESSDAAPKAAPDAPDAAEAADESDPDA